MVFKIVILTMWMYPLLGFLTFKILLNYIKIENYFFKSIVFISLIVILGFAFGVSTTIEEFDWVLITIPYFLLFYLLYRVQYYSHKMIKVIFRVILVFVLLINYLSSTIGILGIGFVLNEFEPANKKKLSKNIVYKEVILGNALSDYRGKRVEIYKTLKTLPFIEQKIIEREYYNIAVCQGPLITNYNEKDKILYLNKTTKWCDSIYIWSDKILIKN